MRAGGCETEADPRNSLSRKKEFSTTGHDPRLVSFRNFFRKEYEAFRGSPPVTITPRGPLPQILGPGSFAAGRSAPGCDRSARPPSVCLCVCGGLLMVADVPSPMEMSQIIHSTHHTHERRPSITASPDSFPPHNTPRQRRH